MFGQTLKKYIVLSLMVTYQIVGLIHTTIPRVNDTGSGHLSVVVNFFHKNHTGTVPRMPFQRSFRSSDENFNIHLINPAKVFLLFFAFFLTGLIVLPKTKKLESFLNAVQVHCTGSYLSLRTIRI